MGGVPPDWQDAYKDIIAILKQNGHDNLIDEIQRQKGIEFDSGRTPTLRNIAVNTFCGLLTKEVHKQIKDGPSEEEAQDYRTDLARRIALAMSRKAPEFRTEHDGKGVPKAERDAVADVVRGGTSLRVTYCEGVFTAVAGNVAGEGLTLVEAVTNLGKKIENFSGASLAAAGQR